MEGHGLLEMVMDGHRWIWMDRDGSGWIEMAVDGYGWIEIVRTLTWMAGYDQICVYIFAS